MNLFIYWYCFNVNLSDSPHTQLAPRCSAFHLSPFCYSCGSVNISDSLIQLSAAGFCYNPEQANLVLSIQCKNWFTELDYILVHLN